MEKPEPAYRRDDAKGEWIGRPAGEPDAFPNGGLEWRGISAARAFGLRRNRGFTALA
ncbi:hypothetical protein GGR03_003869 [Aurantimonas endophytica]|uniref:Uncharacterized protein n=1 Tax=Aurantimonas endophytica TaxID=1522175 RepID=A0A7W6MR90_9HYPH|nr:hypothetical protein [Aurantimonas endophytica]